jgi:hypothetical protein
VGGPHLFRFERALSRLCGAHVYVCVRVMKPEQLRPAPRIFIYFYFGIFLERQSASPPFVTLAHDLPDHNLTAPPSSSRSPRAI